MSAIATIHSVIRTLASGHVYAVYTPHTGSHEGQRREGLISPTGKPVRSAPASVAASPKPASKPARVVKAAPKRDKRTARKPAKTAKPTEPDADFAEVDDLLGDGGRPGIALVERVPSVRPSPRNPTPRKGEKWTAFAGRCAAMGIDFKAASPLWHARKPATKTARKVVAVQQTAKPAPVRKWSEPTIPADASAMRDVDAITTARKVRRESEHGAVDSLNDRIARIEALVIQALSHGN